MARVQILYFAWVRERIGKGGETIELPEGVTTVADLVAHLSRQGPEYAAAFEKPEVVRAALDRQHVKPGAAIGGAREIAFFPPVTGG
jgi:molybdopterin synthase sulfur carrier subunit